MTVAMLAGVTAALLAASASCLHSLEVKEADESMIRIPSTTLMVGSTAEERAELGRQYDFHPSWLADELPAQEVTLKEFWIDRFPVTNRQFAAYLSATGAEMSFWWNYVAWDPARLDHPVVGITGPEAAAYAEWAGKRLPTPEEWECSFQGVEGTPRPIESRLEWTPQTRPVDDPSNATSPLGVGGYGLVSEWTSHIEQYEGSPHRLIKGPSWIHEEQWSFRPQASYYLGDGSASQYIGFRCVADQPVPDRPELSQPLPEKWLKTPTRPSAPVEEEPRFTFPFSSDRGVRVRSSRPPANFQAGVEVISVGDEVDAHYYTTPTVTWHEGENEEAPQRAHFTVHGEVANTTYVFEAGPQWTDVYYLLPNETDESRQMSVSLCVCLFDTFSLYDLELSRSYYWFGEGDWVPMRRLPRTWISRHLTGHTPPQVPSSPKIVAAATRSRDGTSVFAYVRPNVEDGYWLMENPWHTCFHIDRGIEVAPGAVGMQRARLYNIDGDLETLRRRIATDFSL